MEIRNWQRGCCSPGSPPAQAPLQPQPPSSPLAQQTPFVPTMVLLAGATQHRKQFFEHLLWVWESSMCLGPPGGAGRHDQGSTSRMPGPWPGWDHGTGSHYGVTLRQLHRLQARLAQTWLLNGCEHTLDPTVLQDPSNSSRPLGIEWPQWSRPCAHTSAMVLPREGQGTRR